LHVQSFHHARELNRRKEKKQSWRKGLRRRVSEGDGSRRCYLEPIQRRPQDCLLWGEFQVSYGSQQSFLTFPLNDSLFHRASFHSMTFPSIIKQSLLNNHFAAAVTGRATASGQSHSLLCSLSIPLNLIPLNVRPFQPHLGQQGEGRKEAVLAKKGLRRRVSEGDGSGRCYLEPLQRRPQDCLLWGGNSTCPMAQSSIVSTLESQISIILLRQL
jgi:hypothetical protein